MARILLCESCKFGEKICYSNRDNEFFLRDCFLLVHPVGAEKVASPFTTLHVPHLKSLLTSQN